ncbi:Glyco_hydro_17 domain-containing protein, partial [Cephalotus follicularis]
FMYIYVGNQLSASDPRSQYISLAMQNIYNEISSASLQNQIKVSVAIDTNLLGVFNPPSAGAFKESEKAAYMEPIINFLVSTGAPLLANIYPYFRVVYNNQSVPYALFTEPNVVVRDGAYEYKNLFDALMDALYSAVERTGRSSVDIALLESGWPSAGGTMDTVENAGTYYRNFINHVKGGTPKRPGMAIETYLFSMFDEDNKEPEIEKHFGLFYPDKQPKIAENLPSEQDVVDFYKENGIAKMRIYDPNQATLQALQGTNIELILGVPNGDLETIVDAQAAAAWVQNNVLAFSPQVNIRYISVGNEVKPDDQEAQFVLQAMQNIQDAIASANLQGTIKVSTSIQLTLLGNSYPPSAGSFSESASSYINPIIQF